MVGDQIDRASRPNPSARPLCTLGRALLLALSLGACASTLPSQETGPAPSVPLAFADFFVLPVGSRGLEPTTKLLGLRGQRVVVRGYIVEEQEPFPGFFMLAPFPVKLAERADGPADDLPPATLYVHLPSEKRDEIVAYVRGLVEVTGTLELEASEEASGRISYVRLVLDDMTSTRALSDVATERKSQLH